MAKGGDFSKFFNGQSLLLKVAHLQRQLVHSYHQVHLEIKELNRRFGLRVVGKPLLERMQLQLVENLKLEGGKGTDGLLIADLYDFRRIKSP